MMRTNGMRRRRVRANVAKVWKGVVFLSVVCLLGSTSAWTGEADSEVAARAVWVTWHNGNRLLATKVTADAQTIQVESPVFEQPLVLKQDVLASIRQDPPAPGPAKETQKEDEESQTVAEVAPEVARVRVDLSNGDVLFGALIGVDSDTVQLQSPRHGKVVLLRNHVYRLVAAVPDELLFASSGRLEDWKASSVVAYVRQSSQLGSVMSARCQNSFGFRST